MLKITASSASIRPNFCSTNKNETNTKGGSDINSNIDSGKTDD